MHKRKQNGLQKLQGADGYLLRKKQIFNEANAIIQEYANILTIADCIDAASDNIGRPYGLGKTLEDMIAEFNDAKEVRYSGYISELLCVEELQRKINYVINDKRREIYCDIYLRGQ